MLFGTYLVDQGTQSQTIKSYFSTIKHILKMDGYQWSEDKALLNTITKSCKLINDTVKIRLPIQINLLELILFEVNRKFSVQPYLRSLYRAIFSIAYYGLMRIGEIASGGTHPVKARGVHLGNNKNKILLLLRSSKTHGKESRPQKIKIVQILDIKRFYCPFKILRQYFTYRGGYLEDNEGFFVFSDRSAIPADRVCKVLRELLGSLRLDPLLCDTSSLRSGHAVDMYKMRYSLPEIQEKGRWKSNAIYNYLRL